MKKMIKTISIAMTMLTLSAVSQAALQSVENFDAMTGGDMPYNVATVGGGGIWSNNTGGTSGNIYVETNSGSTVIRFMTTTDGINSRGFGFAGIDNMIEDTQKGLLFFRFSIRVEGNAADTYFGLHALSGDTPFSVAGNDPEDYIVAGFRAVNGAGTAVDLVKTKDAGAILMAGLTRGQWYNCWIDADNAANTFDLYISAAGGPAGAATMPTSADKVGDNLPFENTTAYGTSALMGAFFATPRLSSTTRSTTQSARTYIDEVYWDGDEGLALKTKKARNPVPVSGATLVPVDQVLSWDLPNDPNIAQVVGYNVYLDPNETKVATGNVSVRVSASQAGISYDPPGILPYSAQYFWRVDSIIIMDNDPNHIAATIPGDVWRFTIRPAAPVITTHPANGVVFETEMASFSVAGDSASQPVTYSWYKTPDNTNSTPENDGSPVRVNINSDGADTLTVNQAIVADEGYYYCKVTNAGGDALSNTARLGVKRKLARWTLDQSDYDAVNHQYLDALGNYPAILAGVNTSPVFVDGVVIPTATGAVAFDPNSAGVVGSLNPSEFTNQFSLSFWVKWDGSVLPTYGCTALQKGETYETCMWLIRVRDVDANNRASVRFYNNFGYTANAAGVLDADAWAYVCVTYDGSAARSYINGVQVASDSSGSLGTDTAGNLTISAGPDDFAGAIDDVQIYNYTLDPVTVAYLYADASGNSVCMNPNDPVLLTYDFNNNCKVDLGDLAMMASNWLYTQNVPGVPR